MLSKELIDRIATMKSSLLGMRNSDRYSAMDEMAGKIFIEYSPNYRDLMFCSKMAKELASDFKAHAFKELYEHLKESAMKFQMPTALGHVQTHDFDSHEKVCVFLFNLLDISTNTLPETVDTVIKALPSLRLLDTEFNGALAKSTLELDSLLTLQEVWRMLHVLRFASITVMQKHIVNNNL